MAVSVPKPFLELSILEYTSPEHNLKQYKYIHALVQELHLKIELGFINAISELFEEEEILEENTAEKLEQDLNHARKELKDHAILTVSQVEKRPESTFNPVIGHLIMLHLHGFKPCRSIVEEAKI